MPLLVLIVGIGLLTLAWRGNPVGVVQALAVDLGSSSGFFVFVLGFVAIGALGFIKPLKPLSNAFLLLLALVVLLQNRTGFFANLGPELQAIANGTATVGLKGK